MEDYSKYIIKNYRYWSVQVHSNQEYLGRCAVWSKREGVLDLTDTTKDEQEELFMILRELKTAIINSFKPNWFNYSFLENETKHLHGHVVPRYENPVEFNGIMFVDKFWGHNFRLDPNFVTSPELLEAIRLKIKENL